jgi:hypothetical protein
LDSLTFPTARCLSLPAIGGLATTNALVLISPTEFPESLVFGKLATDVSDPYDTFSSSSVCFSSRVILRCIQVGTTSKPRFSMIPIPEVSLLLRGWAEEKRRLRVIARLGGIDFSAFCRVQDVNADGFALVIGSDGRDMIGFLFEGWVFDFSDAPPADNEVLGEPMESAIIGSWKGFELFIFLLF